MNKTDLLFRLFNSFSENEKSKFKTFLGLFSNSKNSLKIFNAYLKYESFVEETFTKFAKLNTEVFRNEKSTLKIRCLEFLRLKEIDKKDNVFFEWRNKLDYAYILRSKGEAFFSDAGFYLKKVIEDSNNNSSSAFTLTAIDEFGLVLATHLKDNYDLHKYYANIEKENILKLNVELEGMAFFNTIIAQFVTSKFIKSDNDIDFIKTNQASTILNFNEESIKNTQLRINLIIAKMCYFYLANDEEANELYLTKFESELINIDINELPNKKEILSNFYFLLVNHFMIKGDSKNLRKYLPSYKKTIDLINSNHWSRYIQLNFESQIKVDHLSNKVIEEYETYIIENKDKISDSIYYSLLLSLIKANILHQKFSEASIKIQDLYLIKSKNSFARNQSDTARLLEIVTQFSFGLQDKLIDNIPDIIRISTSHFNYFKSKKNSLYKFETTFCYFFKTIDSKMNKNLKSELIKLKKKIKNIELEDEYGYIQKVNSIYLNFYKWLDYCIKLC